MTKYPPITVARFWSKVDVGEASECWEWRAAFSGNGYGSFKFRGHANGAHRVAWEIMNGETLGERVACHHCDNPKCCNPEHIYAGDRSSNLRDAYARGQLKVRDQSGESNGASKLTQQDVSDIRRRIDKGETNVRIAKDYPVTHQMVSKIRRGHFWR